MKLIKLQDKFILVSDEVIRDGNYVYDTEAKYIRQLIHKHNETDFDVKIIAGIPELPITDFSLLSEEELSNITTANVEVILENNIYLITKIIKDEQIN